MDTHPNVATIEYPQNLLDAIARRVIDPESTWDEPLPADFKQTLAYVLAGLFDKERKVIELRYEKQLTRTQVAREFNVTQERIRQIEEKAIRKISHPSRRIILTKGINGLIAEARDAGRKEAMRAELRQAVNDVLEIANSAIRIDLAKNETTRYISIPIDDANMPLRARNCLTRAGYKDLGEVCKLTWDELTKIRNMGRKSAQDVVRALKENGLSLAGSGEENDGTGFEG